MMRSLERSILNFPRLFIKQYPYAVFPAIVLWAWPPNLGSVFFAVILAGLLLLRWKTNAWISYTRREHAGTDGKFYVDRPTVPWGRAARSIAVLLVVSTVIASYLNGQFGLSFWQFFLIFVFFTLSYQDFRFFGATAIYIVTAAGIAVYFAPGHLDYKLFFTFKEIARIERTKYQAGKNWDYFARFRDEGADGLLLVPKDVNGFSKRMERLFIVPHDADTFVEQLPYGYK